MPVAVHPPYTNQSLHHLLRYAGCLGKIILGNQQIALLCNTWRVAKPRADNLESNWAYMVITSIAWNLKSWSALLTPVATGQEQEHRAEKKRLLTMEFKTFLSVFIHVPCQIIRHARKTIHRLLNWTDYTPAFFRLCAVLNL